MTTSSRRSTRSQSPPTAPASGRSEAWSSGPSRSDAHARPHAVVAVIEVSIRVGDPTPGGFPTSDPGADSICPERARSAGSRTALAPLQFRKMGCQNERKKLAQIRYQVTCYGIKLESGDLPRFFMIDEIDHARLEKKKSSDCLCQRVRADAVVLARLSFSEASLALSCE